MVARRTYRPSQRELKVRRASFTSRMANFRTLRLLVLERELTLGTGALRLCLAHAASQLYVADGAVVAEVGSNREIIDGADS